jgi:hypothetical protein
MNLITVMTQDGTLLSSWHGSVTGNCVAVSERQITTARVYHEIISGLRNLHISGKGGNWVQKFYFYISVK